MQKILIINGHPDKESLCAGFAESYQRGALASGAECELVHLADLQFNPILQHGYKQRTELEPDLLKMQQLITDASHLVFVYPIWWATFPALLKGFIDRTFLPRFAFAYRENSQFWDKLLTGKSARIIVTMDSPKWYYSLFTKKPGIHAIRKGVLQFCGINPVKVTGFAPIKTADEKQIAQWLFKVEELGKKQL